MKKFILGISLLLALPEMAFAQANGCNYQSHPWEIARRGRRGTVYYAVESTRCLPEGGVCGWPKISLQHTIPYPATVSVTLIGVDCQGQPVRADFSTGGTAIPASQPYKESGNWHRFKQVAGVVRVEVSYYVGSDLHREVYDRDNNLEQFTINNRTPAEIAAAKEAKEKQEARAKEEAGPKGSGNNGGQNGGASGSAATSAPRRAAPGQATERARIREAENEAAARQAHDQEMKARAAAQEARAAADRADVAAAAAGIGGLMLATAGLKDNPETGTRFSLKATLGLGLQNLPLTFNERLNGAAATSKADETIFPCVQVGAQVLFLNHLPVCFRLAPFASYGKEVFSTVQSGSHFSYGVGGGIGVGSARLRVLAQGEYAHRSGALTTDYAPLNTDIIGWASYDYATFRYGPGVRLVFKDKELDDSEAALELVLYRESISFLRDRPASVYSYELRFTQTYFDAFLGYGPNYPIAGQLANPGSYQVKAQDYYQFGANIKISLLVVH